MSLKTLKAETDRLETETYPERLIGELLAIIHCDGGHYVAEHGIVMSVEDAINKTISMKTRIAYADSHLHAIRNICANVSISDHGARMTIDAIAADAIWKP